MNDLNSQRYQFITKIKTYSQGKLFHGKDLSLQRNVLLYQLKTNLSAEESLELIRRVNGFNHPNFLHILDIGHSDQGVLAVLELRNGSILSEIVESSDYSFQKCLELTIEVGKMVEMALEEGIRGFSISTDNLWLTDEQTLMGINYWATGEEKFRGALGLFHFLYQLLSKSIEIPDTLEEIKENLHTIKHARSLSHEEATVLDGLLQEAYAPSSSSLSFILLLSKFMHSQVEQKLEEPITVPEDESITKPFEKRWAPTLWSWIERIKKDGIPEGWNLKSWFSKLQISKSRSSKDWNFKDKMRDVWLEKKKPLLAVAILVVVMISVFKLVFQEEQPNPLDEMAALSPIPAETEGATPQHSNQDGQDNREETAGREQPVEQEQAAGEQEQPTEEQYQEGFVPTETNENPSSTIEDNSEQSDIIEVPQFIGLTQQEAEQQALSAGLRYEYFIEMNELQAGTVFRQDMEAGASVNKGTKITFWVSKGLEL